MNSILLRSAIAASLGISVLYGEPELREVPVDLMCHPVIRIGVASLPTPVSRSLLLTHVLVDGGARYISLLRFPFLSSTLVPSDHNIFRWTTLSGGIVPLALGHWSGADGNEFTIGNCGKDLQVVHNRDKTIMYNYAHGRLLTASIKSLRYTFVYTGGRLQNITQQKPPTELLRLFYSAGGMVERIVAGKDVVKLTYDDCGRLIHIQTSMAKGVVINATYANGGLIRTFEVNGRAEHFDWTKPEWREYWRPFIPLEPVLRSDGINTYQVTQSFNGVTVSVFDKTGKRKTGWEVRQGVFRALSTSNETSQSKPRNRY